MLIAWIFTFALSIFIGYKSKIYSLYILAGGMIPVILFYAYTAFSVWPDYYTSVIYSRISYLSFLSALITSLVLMYRSVHYGRR